MSKMSWLDRVTSKCDNNQLRADEHKFRHKAQRARAKCQAFRNELLAALTLRDQLDAIEPQAVTELSDLELDQIEFDRVMYDAICDADFYEEQDRLDAACFHGSHVSFHPAV